MASSVSPSSKKKFEFGGWLGSQVSSFRENAAESEKRQQLQKHQAEHQFRSWLMTFPAEQRAIAEYLYWNLGFALHDAIAGAAGNPQMVLNLALKELPYSVPNTNLVRAAYDLPMPHLALYVDNHRLRIREHVGDYLGLHVIRIGVRLLKGGIARVTVEVSA